MCFREKVKHWLDKGGYQCLPYVVLVHHICPEIAFFRNSRALIEDVSRILLVRRWGWSLVYANVCFNDVLPIICITPHTPYIRSDEPMGPEAQQAKKITRYWTELKVCTVTHHSEKWTATHGVHSRNTKNLWTLGRNGTVSLIEHANFQILLHKENLS